jgi:hypothetical protein
VSICLVVNLAIAGKPQSPPARCANGVLWVAQTRKAWCADTLRSLGQYNRALRELKERGLVETSTWKTANGLAKTSLRGIFLPKLHRGFRV